MTITVEQSISELKEAATGVNSGHWYLTPYVEVLLAHIDTQATRINEQNAELFEQSAKIAELTMSRKNAWKQASAARQGFDEQYALREAAEKQLAALQEPDNPFAYSYCYAGCETCEGFQDWRNELSIERPPQWMIESGKVEKLVPLFTRPASVAVPDDETLRELVRAWNRAPSPKEAYPSMREVLRLNSGSKSNEN